jgi:hypothetical protein
VEPEAELCSSVTPKGHDFDAIAIAADYVGDHVGFAPPRVSISLSFWSQFERHLITRA